MIDCINNSSITDYHKNEKAEQEHLREAMFERW